MIKNRYALAIFVTTIFLAGFSINIQAQCLTCAPSDRVPGAITCQASSSGGKECQAQGDTCILAGVCRRAPVLPPGDDGNTLTASSGIKTEIDPTLIRQIAGTHPRFAYALATLVKNGLLGKDELKIYIVPRPITAEDVERLLTAGQLSLMPTEKDSLYTSNRIVRKQDKIDPVIYDVSFQNSKLVINAVQKSSSDPAYIKLEIDFTEINEASGEGKILKAGNWRVF